MNRRVGDELERLGVLIVTDNFFETLGVRARLGRTFTATKPPPNVHRVSSSWIIRTGTLALAPTPASSARR